MEEMLIHRNWLQYERAILRERSIATLGMAFESKSFRRIASRKTPPSGMIPAEASGEFVRGIGNRKSCRRPLVVVVNHDDPIGGLDIDLVSTEIQTNLCATS